MEWQFGTTLIFVKAVSLVKERRLPGQVVLEVRNRALKWPKTERTAYFFKRTEMTFEGLFFSALFRIDYVFLGR